MRARSFLQGGRRRHRAARQVAASGTFRSDGPNQCGVWLYAAGQHPVYVARSSTKALHLPPKCAQKHP
jgi:hypothetical protein